MNRRAGFRSRRNRTPVRKAPSETPSRKDGVSLSASDAARRPPITRRIPGTGSLPADYGLQSVADPPKPFAAGRLTGREAGNEPGKIAISGAFCTAEPKRINLLTVYALPDDISIQNHRIQRCDSPADGLHKQTYSR